MSNLVPSLKKFGVPVICGLAAIMSSACAFNAGGLPLILSGLSNLAIAGYAIYLYAKSHEKE